VIDQAIMDRMKKEAVVLHPLPRVDEVCVTHPVVYMYV
jgi:aspartate carbamoyltransferase catalytic subunit